MTSFEKGVAKGFTAGVKKAGPKAETLATLRREQKVSLLDLFKASFPSLPWRQTPWDYKVFPMGLDDPPVIMLWIKWQKSDAWTVLELDI